MKMLINLCICKTNVAQFVESCMKLTAIFVSKLHVDVWSQII